MTAIAAIARDGVVTVGADAGSGGGDLLVLGARKIRHIDVAGHSGLLTGEGNGGIVAFLARQWSPSCPPPVDDDDSDWQSWVDLMASEASELLHDAEPSLTGESPDGITSHSAMLLGVAGRLIYLYTHQGLMAPDGIASLGSAADLVLGYLHGSTEEPPRAVESAIRLACQYSAGCAVSSAGPMVEECR